MPGLREVVGRGPRNVLRSASRRMLLQPGLMQRPTSVGAAKHPCATLRESDDPALSITSSLVTTNPERAVQKGVEAMAFNRQHIRESIERAGEEHWQALVRHHTNVYPQSNPTPGDVCRAEAERLNLLDVGDNPSLKLVASRVERIPPAVRITHVFEDRETGTQFDTEPFTNYE